MPRVPGEEYTACRRCRGWSKGLGHSLYCGFEGKVGGPGEAPVARQPADAGLSWLEPLLGTVPVSVWPVWTGP